MTEKFVPHYTERVAAVRDQLARQEGLSASGARCATGDATDALGASNVRDEIEDFPEVSEVGGDSSLHAALHVGITPSTSDSIRWARAP